MLSFTSLHIHGYIDRLCIVAYNVCVCAYVRVRVRTCVRVSMCARASACVRICLCMCVCHNELCRFLLTKIISVTFE